MSWKWCNGDNPCHSQNLPQNLGKYYVNELIFELIAVPADRAQSSSRSGLHFEHSCCQLTPPVCRQDEVAAKKNSTLAVDSVINWPENPRSISTNRPLKIIMFLPTTRVTLLARLREYQIHPPHSERGRGLRPHLWCPGYDIKLHLVMRLQILELRSVECTFITITPWSTLTQNRVRVDQGVMLDLLKSHLWVKYSFKIICIR